MAELTVTVESFTPHLKNTLKGYCSAKIAELALVINGIGIHARNGHSWITMPARPMVKDDRVVRRHDDTVIYIPTLEFTNAKALEAFGAAIIKSLLERNPDALDDWRAPQ
jgi:hypothetical protein